ncbi:MAG: helix-turn-helix domain-containing protein [Polyangiaceae bacterium]
MTKPPIVADVPRARGASFDPKSVVVIEGSPAFASAAPHPSLRAHVSAYWTVRCDGPRHTIRSLPDGCVDVAFDLLASTPSAFVTGPQRRARTFEVEGKSHLVGVRIAPGACFDLLGAPVAEGDLWVPLARWLGDAGVELAVRVGAARALADRAALLDAFFLARLADLRGARGADPRLTRAIHLVFETAGAARVAELAKAAHASERTLARLFSERVGTSPKRFARIARFQDLLRRIDGPPDWGAFAMRTGYADQAHMIRDFKELFGCTPGEALALGAARERAEVEAQGADASAIARW